jgi:hypothetical protein
MHNLQENFVARWVVALAALGWSALGCGGSSGGAGAERQACYANGTCNAGLTCLSKVCVAPAGQGGHGGTAGAGGGAGTDGGQAGAAGSGGAAGATAGAGGGVAGSGGAAGATAGAGGGATAGAGGGVAAPPALGAQIDRMGRPYTSLFLTDPFDASASTRGMKLDSYGVGTPTTANSFQAGFESSLAIFDGFDTVCGNQFLASSSKLDASRYAPLANLLLDDQLYVDTSSGSCTSYLAVELNAVGGLANTDCGGRTLTEDVIDTTYSLLVVGAASGLMDGVAADVASSNTTFPFLGAPN